MIVKVPPVILMGYQEGCFLFQTTTYLNLLPSFLVGYLSTYLPNLNTENALKKRTPTPNNWFTKNGSA